MKLLVIALLIASPVMAAVSTFEGSGTVKEAMTKAIHQAKLDEEIVFIPSSSGKSLQAVLDGKQGIAATTNSVKKEIIEQGKKKGIEWVEHVIGLDGVAILVNTSNKTKGLSLDQLNRIFSCNLTQWDEIPDSELTGTISVFRHDDTSGTTDFIKTKTGMTAFGSCAKIVNDLKGEIGKSVSSDKNGIGFTSLASKRAKNRVAAVSIATGDAGYPISKKTVQSGEYPLSRKLYFYEASGTVSPNESEKKLLKFVLNKKLFNRILSKTGFFPLP